MSTAKVLPHTERAEDPPGVHKTPLTPHQERAVAVAAGCDPRRVRAFLRGDPTRSTTSARIAEALQKLGLGVSAPKPEAPAASPAAAA